MFLEHNWLVNHNPEVIWGKRTIWFTRYPKTCRIKYQNITLKTRKAQEMEI